MYSYLMYIRYTIYKHYNCVHIHTYVYCIITKFASQKPYIEVISWENGSLFICQWRKNRLGCELTVAFLYVGRQGMFKNS